MRTQAVNSEDVYRWKRRKEERPREILHAALKIFSISGFSSTKLDVIAKEAGISKGTLYLYFPNKAELFKSVVTEFVLPQIEKAEKQASNHSGSIYDLLFMLLEHWQENVLETELSGISKLMVSESSNFPELATFYLENVIQRIRVLLEKLIDLGIENGEFNSCNSSHAARAFLTPLVFSAIWKHSLAAFDEDYDVKGYLRFHLETFLHGLMKGKS